MSRAAHEAIEHSLTNQAPADHEVVARFEALRVNAKAFGHDIIDLCPESRERSLALTKLEEAVMWAVKAVACHQADLPLVDASRVGLTLDPIQNPDYQPSSHPVTEAP